MSSERDEHEAREERLDAMLAPLRESEARLDEITRARVGARLEAALAGEARQAPAGRIGAERWRWRGLAAAAVGIAAAAAVVIAVAARGGGRSEGGARETAKLEAAGSAGASGTGASAAAPSAVASSTGASAAGSPARGTAGTPSATPSTPAAPADPAAPIVVAAGASAQLTLDGAAITVYGPGRLAPAQGGAVVEAPGLVVDRTQGDAPWTVRYHGVEIVATRATFALDRGTEPRVTVMRGELELRCPSGTRTVRSGASATCGRAVTAALPPPQAQDQAPIAAEVPAAPPPSTAERYAAAESAMRRGDPDAAREALLAVVAAEPASLDAATALLDLARLAARRGDALAARGHLDRLDQHPRRAALAAPAARLRATLAQQPAP